MQLCDSDEYYWLKTLPLSVSSAVNTFLPRPLWPRVDPYGFERSEDFDYESYEELMSEYLVVLTRRSIKWSKLLKGKSKVQKNLKRTCQKLDTHDEIPLMKCKRGLKWYVFPLPSFSFSEALCAERDSQRAPGSDLDGSQRRPRPVREERRILPVAAGSPARPQTGGDDPHRSVWTGWRTIPDKFNLGL